MSRYFNRESSWLEFNRRVLALAGDPTVPLLERIKFCAIFSSNLDEFFQVRVAGLKDQIAAGLDARGLDGRRPAEQLDRIAEVVGDLASHQCDVFAEELVPALARAGIELVGWKDLSAEERAEMQEVYDERIFPVLTPLSVDPSHPFPYISNLSLNLAATVRNPDNGERRFARVKVPPLLPRFLPVGRSDSATGPTVAVGSTATRLLPLEQLIDAQLDSLFPGMRVEAAHVFRVTRNADLTLVDEEADDLLAAVEMELRRRRFGRAVRLEVTREMPADVRALLVEELELEPGDVTVVDGLLDLSALWSLHAVERPDLKDEVWGPRTQARLTAPEGEPDMFAVLRAGDLLVHHPYDSFATSVERFVRQAAQDPNVLTIKLTLYRTSGDSPVVRALIDAVERGKQVAVVVELKARFDEQANIAWARQLEEAGVHVVYGLVGLKTHTKVVLIVRNEGDKLRRYAHVASGNYNSSTARLYEDLGLFSADPILGADLTKLFNALTGYARPAEYARIIVAPEGMRSRILELIAREHQGGPDGRPGAITMKMNSLVDPAVIDALYAASAAGVSIDLIVRGICCLRPGVPGLSEHIRVRSIVGRFLEHSRIYRFANADGPGRPAHFIGSADMMQRNLDHRVEALVPVPDPALAAEIDRIIAVQLDDNALAWTLDQHGTWSRAEPADGDPRVDSQVTFQRWAIERSGTP